LAYRFYANAKARAVLILLPGFALTSQDYVAFCSVLAQRTLAAVYSLDLRGHGDSGGRQGDVDYVGQLSDDVRDALAHIRNRHPDIPVGLCAHSSGCSLAIQLLSASGAPKLMGLFLIAPVFCGHLEFDRRQTWLHRLVHLCRQARRLPNTAPSKFQINQQFRFFLARYILAPMCPGGQRITVLTVRANDKLPSIRYTRRFYQGYRCADPRAQLSRLSCPVWMMVGEEDEFTQPAAVISVVRWYVAPNLLRNVQNIRQVGHFTVFSVAATLLAQWIKPVLHLEPAMQGDA
jgi:alpha-beta hydrolase superfamily lysophospholipase